MDERPGDERTRRMAFVLIPRFNMMALTTTIEPLRIANYLSPAELYSWVWLSVDGGSVAASNGMTIETGPVATAGEDWDQVLVCGSWGCERFEDETLFAWLRRLARRGVDLGALDIGSYVLARAGLLGGHRAAVHWYCIHAFAESFPATRVEEAAFAVDGSRMTVAGGTAGLDAMLDDIGRRHGHQFADEVADWMLYRSRRAPDAPQRRAEPAGSPTVHRLVHRTIALMEKNIEETLAVPVLAERVGVSQRKLERLFQRDLGTSVVGFYRMLRLQFARVLLTNTDMSIREVSIACGFSSLSHFARAFVAQFGRRPRDHREAWPAGQPAPTWPGTSTLIAELSRKANTRRRDAA